MTHPPQFFKQLFLFSTFVAVLVGLGSFIPTLRPYQDFSWMSFAFYVLLSIAIYWAANLGAKSSNKALFNNLLLVFMGGKMFLSLILLSLYYFLTQPTSKIFVLPFLVIYFLYSIFEVYFLIKLAKE